jgi:hypothetical protein
MLHGRNGLAIREAVQRGGGALGSLASRPQICVIKVSRTVRFSPG